MSARRRAGGEPARAPPTLWPPQPGLFEARGHDNRDEGAPEYLMILAPRHPEQPARSDGPPYSCPTSIVVVVFDTQIEQQSSQAMSLSGPTPQVTRSLPFSQAP